MNIYFDVMTELIFKYEGTIDEFIGDAILAIFGAPIRHGDDVERAVACALEMQLAMEGVNDTLRREGLPPLEMGIGLNTGEVIVGNIGSRRRMKYSVVGRNVNLASRIESYTVGGQILISESTLQACGEQLRTGQTLTVSPKGVPQPICIHEVLGITGTYEVSLREQQICYLDLPHALPIEFAVVDGKHAQSQTHAAKLVRVTDPDGAFFAEIHSQSDCYELTNLRVAIRQGEGRVVGSIYARVTERIAGRPGEFRVRFTSVPPEARNLLRAALIGR